MVRSPPEDPGQPKRPRSRLRKITRGVSLGLLAVIVLPILAVTLFLASLDTAFVRGHVRALTHLPIDWQHTELSLTSGIVLRGLSFANPGELAAAAPELLHIDRIEVSWALGKLFGAGPLAERIRIVGLRAAVVVDEAGHSSLSALGGGSSEPAGPPTPRSGLLAALGKRLPLERATLHDARLRLIHVRRSGNRSAEVALELEAALPGPNELALTVDVSLLNQDLVEDLPPIRDVLHLQATASFRPQEHRLIVEVPVLRGLDTALTGSAKVELPDEGAPRIDALQLSLDTRPIQATLSHSKSPLQLAGTLSVRIRKLRAGRLPIVEHDGAIEVDAKLDHVHLASPTLTVRGQRLSIDLDLKAAPLRASGTDQRGAATLKLGVGELELTAGRFRLALGALKLDTQIDGLDPFATEATALVERVRTQGHLGRLLVRPGALIVAAEDIGLDTDLKLPGVEPGALAIDAPIARVAVQQGARALLGVIVEERLERGEPGRMHLGLTGLRLVLADPLRSEGHERSELSAGPLRIRSQLDKNADDAVAFDLDVQASSLAPLATVVSLPGGVAVPWPQLGAHLHARGRVAGLRKVASLQIEEASELELTHVSVRGGPAPLEAQRLALELKSKGGLTRHEAELRLATEALVVLGESLGSPRIDLGASVDRATPSMHLKLEVHGGELPQLSMTGGLAFSSGARLKSELSIKAGKLGLIGRLLPRTLTARHQIAWDRLAIELEHHGDVRHALSSLADFKPRLVADPGEHARGDVAARLVLRGLDYQDKIGEQGVTLDEAQLSLSAHAEDGDAADARPLRKLALGLVVDRASIVLPGRALTAHGLAPTIEVTARGPTRAPQLLASLALELASLEQDFYAPYPLGKLHLAAALRADTQGLLRLERFDLDNQLAGSKLSLRGGVDLRAPRKRRALDPDALLGDDQDAERVTTGDTPRRLPGRVGLDCELALEQRLGTFPIVEGLEAQGVLKLPLRVQSGDLSLFALHGTLALEGVSLKLPSAKLTIDAMRGKVPVSAEIMLERRRGRDGTPSLGLRLVPHADPVSFPRPRFAEHQPFLAERSFFAMDKLKLGRLEVGPLAGNLAIDHTRVELAQLEVDIGVGRFRGQMLADLAGQDSKIALRGNVTGLQPPSSSRREDRLDANLALVVEPMRLLVEGRTELVHISRAMLLDLLDLWDPYRAEVGANRARLGLKLGYPKSVRLAFEQGFASLKLELGGLTRAIRIDEIKGVPIGPLLERYLAVSLRPLMMSSTETAPQESAP